MSKSFKTLCLLVALFANSKAFSCASCGSGGDDPLILYPWETWKAFVGFGRTSEFELVDTNGEIGREIGPEARNTTLMSLGRSFNSRSFATFTAPYIVNKRREREMSGWGNSLLAFRYTVIQQDLTNEAIPQVQLISSLRSGEATSIYETKDPSRLDVRGSGVPEGRLGVDIWSGMSAWKYGFAQTVTTPLSTIKTEYGEVKPGVGLRTTITGGYGWSDSAKVIGGVNREYSTRKQVDGQSVEDSEMLGHGVFVSGDAMVQKNTSIRLTWIKSASILENRNISRNQTVTLAMMRSF